MRLTLPRLDITDPAALLADLRGTTPLAAADTPDTDRSTSLGASITYSYAHLTERTRRLLPAISLFYGIADEDVLQAFSADPAVPSRFAGISKVEWRAVLDDATRVGLLVGLGAGMFKIHPALPGYLAAGWHAENPADYQLEREACEQALCAACANFCVWLNQQLASSDAAFAYTLLRLQRRTLGAMLGYALDHHAWADATDIIQALDPYWDSRGLSAEATAWSDRILDATLGPGQTPPEAARMLWLYTIFTQATRLKDAGRPDRAAQVYRRVLAVLQDQPETEWTRGNIATTYHQLGMTAKDRGLLDEADDWYRKSLALQAEFGDRRAMASTYAELGIASYRRGRLDESEDWGRKALAIREELGDRPGVARAYHQLGNAAYLGGRLAEAWDLYTKALAIFEELGDRPGLADIYHQLGVTTQSAGLLEETDGWYRKCLAIREELGDRPGMAAIYHQLGMTAELSGRLDDADDWYQQSLAISEDLGLRLYMATSYSQLGATAFARGRLDDALGWFRQALAIREEIGDLPGLAFVNHRLGVVAHAGGRFDEADDRYRRSVAISNDLGDGRRAALTYAQLALLAEDRDQDDLALAWNIRCVTLFDEFPSPLAGTGPSALARLARQLGMPALEEAWQQVTGQPVPQPVRDYITSHQDQDEDPEDSA
jgi:tetratricopeptide (TPR) repeat protein